MLITFSKIGQKKLLVLCKKLYLYFRNLTTSYCRVTCDLVAAGSYFSCNLAGGYSLLLAAWSGTPENASY